MDRFFNPAVSVVRNLALTQKMMMMGVLLLVLSSIQSYFFTQQTERDIHLAQQKQLGVEYSVALRKLLEHLPLYRGMAFAVAQGDSELAEHADRQLLVVAEAVRSVDEVNNAIGKRLQLFDHWTDIKDKWARLNNKAAYLSPESRFEHYSTLLDEIQMLLLRAGDNSSLVLDENIKSYYLMSIMVSELPAIISVTQTLRGLTSSQALPAGALAGGHTYLQSMLGILQAHQVQIILMQDKVLVENPQLSEQLNSQLDNMRRHLSNYIMALQQQDNRLSSTEMFESGTAAVQSIFRYYDTVAVELDGFLQQQLESLQAARNWSIAIITLCLLITLYLCAGVYISIMRNIQALVKATEYIAMGDVAYRVNVTSKDELGKVAGGFNSMAKSLQSSQHEVAEALKKLECLASLDPLTGLHNRRCLDEVLDKEWRRARRTKSMLCALMLDIDHFKQFNAIYGHQGGDQCLKQVAQALNSNVQRAGDFVARYGGEEFIIILPNCTLKDARQLAEKILDRIEGLQITHAGSVTCDFVSVSIGVAASEPGRDGECIETLIERADKALYQAKENGRNQLALDSYSILKPVGGTRTVNE